ncbi:MAG: hypothetical protein GY856_52910 [bacterium]|nr:hypothetical protein [bacterium]
MQKLFRTGLYRDRRDRLQAAIGRWLGRLSELGAEAAFSPRHRAWCLCACIAMIVAKAPGLVLDPRFWAEEGTVYFAYARHHTVLQSLFLVPTSTNPAGYLLLAANLPATVAARLVPLELAPWVTTLSALLIQALPFAVVLFGESHLWRTPLRRLLVCLILLFAPPLVGEVWLNSINSQLFCGLIAVLILGEDLRSASRRRARIYRGLLVFCGLSGPYTGLLFPAFLLKHRLEATRESRLHVWIVAAVAAVQAVLLFWTRWAFALGPERFAWRHWGERAANVFFHQVLRAVLGEDAAPWVVKILGLSEAVARDDIARGYLRLSGWTCTILVGLVVWWLARRPQSRYQLLLPVSLLSIMLAIAPSIGGLKPGGRYAVVPGLLLLLMIFTHAVSSTSPAGAWAARAWTCRLLLGVALAVGVATYWREIPPGALGRLPGKPLWTHEVAAWRQDPAHALAIWPYVDWNSWAVSLPRPAAYDAIREPLTTAPFRLVSFGDWTDKTFAVGGLPIAFKVVLDVHASQAATRTDLRLRLEDRDGALLTEHEIRGFRQETSQRVLIDSPEDLELPADRRFADVRRVTVAMRSKSRSPIQVTVNRLHLGPRVEGVLEPILPPVSLPTVLYPGDRRQPVAAEATAVLATESMLRDGDLIFDERDLRRSLERWPDGARGLRLRSVGGGAAGGRLGYAGSAVYPLVSLPLFAVLGPAGQVLLNIGLFLGMLAPAWHGFAGAGRTKGVVILGFFCASAALGWVFLPQPEVLRMFCLFVPASWWIRSRLGEPGERPARLRLLAAGSLLALAALEAPFLGWVGAAVAAHLAVERRWRQVAFLGIGALLTSAVLSLCWAPCGGIGQTFSPAPQVVWQDQLPGAENVEVLASQALAPIPSASREWTIARWTRQAWFFLVGRAGGLLPCYPFALVAVILFAAGAESRSRLLLFAVVLVLCAWTVWKGGTDGAELLGSGELAVIYPLFFLLPPRWSLRRGLWLPFAVAFFFTLPVLDRVWRPSSETAGEGRPVPAIFEILPAVAPDSGRIGEVV